MTTTTNPQARLLISFLELLPGEDNILRAIAITRLGIAVSTLIGNKELYELYSKELFGYPKNQKPPDYRIIKTGNRKIEFRISWSKLANIYRLYNNDPEKVIVIDGVRIKFKIINNILSKYIDTNSPVVGDVLADVLNMKSRPPLPEITLSPEMESRFLKALEKMEEQ